MIKIRAGLLIFLLTLISNVHPSYSGGDNDKAEGKDSFQKVNFMIDFTDYQDGSVEEWLQAKGFQFERDARGDNQRLLKSPADFAAAVSEDW